MQKENISTKNLGQSASSLPDSERIRNVKVSSAKGNIFRKTIPAYFHHTFYMYFLLLLGHIDTHTLI